MEDFDRGSMLESFIYEMGHLLEQLENNIVQAEEGLSNEAINEIFRIMHTIKGSAAMMLYDTISTTSHAIEDLFFYLRENKPADVDTSIVTDLTLEVGDFVRGELDEIVAGNQPAGDSSELIQSIKEFVQELKIANGDAPAERNTNKQVESSFEEETEEEEEGEAHRFHAEVYFQANSEMENVRAYTIIHNLKEIATDITHDPEDLLDESGIQQIRQKGFFVDFVSDSPMEKLHEEFMKSLFIRDLELVDQGPCKTGKKSESAKNDSGNSSENVFEAFIKFEEGCEMENVRAYGLVYNLTEDVISIESVPEDLINEASIEDIKRDGLKLTIVTGKTYDEIFDILNGTIYLSELNLKESSAEIKKKKPATENKKPNVPDKKVPIKNIDKSEEKENSNPQTAAANPAAAKKTPTQHAISVSVQKLDLLLNLVGELVTSEAMVTQNPDLEGLLIDSFTKEASQLRKIIKDVQDTVMSMRMVPLSPTFFKMHRIVRDMCKQLGKEVNLEIVGENTEVDKNIIEHIADPLMHIIRNSVDHGIEMPEDRKTVGKDMRGTIILEAKNSGGDVLINVKDDGAGLNRDKILAKARNQGLLTRNESEYSDKEIYNFIFLPGFSTNEAVTSYSGRGVGMDVVTTNIEMVGGTVLADSTPSKGSTFTLKIPLTLAIIEGMTIKLGDSKFTIPIVSIIRSFKARKEDLVIDPNGNEMIMVRGECYNLVRLREEFKLNYGHDDIEEGIVMMLENGSEVVCVHVDELIGEQQVVVKNIPKYIKKTRGISGCAILGNGDISLIIDVAGFFDH